MLRRLSGPKREQYEDGEKRRNKKITMPTFLKSDILNVIVIKNDAKAQVKHARKKRSKYETSVKKNY
jgi:hypothetical protein